MQESIALYGGDFGRISILRVLGGFVTHAHRESHIVLWLDGTAGEMIVGRRKVVPGPDVAMAINAFEPHSYTLLREDGWSLFLNFYIEPDWLRRRRGIAPGVAAFARPFIPLDRALRHAVSTLLAGLTLGAGGSYVPVCEVERVIDRLMDAVDSGRPRECPPPPVFTTYDFRIRKAIRLMNANVTTRICFDQLARSVGLSRPHFFALFRDQMNITPNIYWNALRMEEAFRHLQNGEDTLAAVAYDLGFTTQGNFSRFFRDHVGVPPTVYRSAARMMATRVMAA